jgi:hypothetical protein
MQTRRVIGQNPEITIGEVRINMESRDSTGMPLLLRTTMLSMLMAHYLTPEQPRSSSVE